jgi:type IV secretion system protein VirB4
MLSVREEADLDNALRGTLALEPAARRLSDSSSSRTRPGAMESMRAFRAGARAPRGDYAWAFDNPSDTLSSSIAESTLFGADVTEFLDNEITRAPVTLYLFHVIRTLLDGRRFVCWADEFSRLLADPAFEQFAKDGLKVWRKLNGVLCAATQSPSDALSSSIARTIIEQTPTKILFPNSDAKPEEYIEGFGLSEREFKLIKEQLEPGSRMFLVKQGHYSIVCQLDLKGFGAELAVISGRASSVERLYSIMERLGPKPEQWLPEFERASEG